MIAPRFEPAPRNDFGEYIALYFQACRAQVPRIAAIAGKWAFEDLIPGLSDFDTRFIVEDGMTLDDWCAMSAAVGQVHHDLCRRYPHWARNLEHLPGINLTWSELTGPDSYYPEYPQWTFYHTTDAARLQAAHAYLARRPWSAPDELFHLKKFCLYYGRYNRTIDKAINLGVFESKYPLHSRFLHYFCPPVQAAMSLLERRPVCGKLDSVRLAIRRFPEAPVFREMLDVIDAHYECPALYDEPELSRLEDRLEAGLARLKEAVAPHLTVIPRAVDTPIDAWRTALKQAPQNPLAIIFDASRFSRLMKGRLTFYATAPHHFDTFDIVENELGRMDRNFFQIPFGTFWKLKTGETVADAATIVSRLCPDIITEEEAQTVHRFHRLLLEPRRLDNHQQVALEVARVFDGFFRAQNKVVAAARQYGHPPKEHP